MMADPVSAIRNLGPATSKLFARAGIHTADQVRAMGADAAYQRLLQSGTRPHFIGYYALVLGLQGRPWNDCKGAEKISLRQRFDALKDSAYDKGRSELETALNAMGIIYQSAIGRRLSTQYPVGTKRDRPKVWGGHSA